MIKGVTKNMIEKAIIILKENCSLSEDEIRKETQITIGNTPVFLKTIKTQIKIKMAICALSGALSAVLLCGTLLWVAGF